MRKKILAMFIAITTAICGTVGLTACNNNNSDSNKWGSEYSFTAAYAQAQELGYAGTLEEFIAMISGKDGKDGTNGTDGLTPHIRIDGYWWIGDTNTGVKAIGIDGKDGDSVKDAFIDHDGHLIVVLTNDEELDCGEVLDVHTHDYGEWLTVLEASCIQVGLQMRVCEACGNTEAKFTEKTEHDWSSWYSYTDDEHLRHCGICQKHESATHEFDEDGYCPDCGKYNLVLPIEGEIITNYDFIFDPNSGAYRFHTGMDISADEGAEVVAAMGGTVESIIYNDQLDGTNITIAHFNGLKVKYKFIDVNPELKIGDRIKQGEVIGTISAACGGEMKFGDHLHFEISKNGLPQSPIEYLFGVSLTE